MLVYEALAEAFIAEGVDTHFTLMGDGNMHWTIALEKRGVTTIHARHEHCACIMAAGYHAVTGQVGVASVTCGPGLTQIMGSLATAARARIPLAIFAGEVPLHQKWHEQAIDQQTLARASGAEYIPVHSLERVSDRVQEAFYIAAFERRPVVLGLPQDLQQEIAPRFDRYVPSRTLIPDVAPALPDPVAVKALARRLAEARRPLIIGGRGALRSGAGHSIERMADACGALLANTLPVLNLFDGNPYSLGLVGGYASEAARDLVRSADVVVAVGASLTSQATDSGALLANAFVAQIDEHPKGFHHGRPVADLYLKADAALACEAITAALGEIGGFHSQLRTNQIARAIREASEDRAHFDVEAGTLDPREVARKIDDVIPKDWHIVGGAGHSSAFYAYLKGRRPERIHIVREFSAIGNAFSLAIGVAVASGNGNVVVLDGDGGLLMHIQELETIARHGIKMLICALNDGAFGAEIHKLRAEGIEDRAGVFGRPDFAAIGRSFGIGGATITELNGFEEAFSSFQSTAGAAIWDIHISEKVISPQMRRLFAEK